MTRRAHADALIRDAMVHRYDFVAGSTDLICTTCKEHKLPLSALPRDWRRQTLRDLAALGMLAGDALTETNAQE